MIRLESDYLEGAVKEVLDLLVETNDEQTEGYGTDRYCQLAKEAIKKYLNHDSDIHFVVGGTAANQIVISHCLRSHEGVMASTYGHIANHETGAIEATGHKVIIVSNNDKVSVEELDSYVSAYNNDGTKEHIVKPKMLYISNPTENGLIYTKKELEGLYDYCQKHNLYLYIDGARLMYSLSDDLKLEDYARLSDVFYIGGTKCGLLFGEAIVINNDNLKDEFRYGIKQRGQMLAKGRLLGVQFYALFRDGLFFRMGSGCNALALHAREELEKKGIKFLNDSKSNQQFMIVSKEKYEEIKTKISLQFWQDLGENCVLRYCVSPKTKKEDIEYFINLF